MKIKLLHFVTLLTILALPGTILAQAPTLGTAANFVLFTTTGAVTNTGISQITGDVGTNSGAITGFGNVNGNMQTSNGATAAAAADLQTAYNQLNAAIPTFFHAPLLGNGDTLTAGVHSVSGAATLNLNLYLDAQNNPNAVFIIQVAGPLSTNALSEVVLINGAQACNVFWKVEGLVSMASGTKMRGNVVANNAAIDMQAGVTLEGRALSTAGAITLNNTKAYIPSGCGSPVLTGPANPPLGSVGCYALFSSNGSNINAGITNVTGDVGTNVGLTVGYNPLLVNGTIHPIPDVSTANAASDLLVLYNFLNGLAPDIELLYPAQFGNNLVLTPHTYLMNGAASLNDTLFLNAEGNPNAVFVIKISGALSTSTFSQVVLMNGAQAKNVFWKVEGAVSINDYSNFVGTVVANNGAVNLATGANIDGRALTTTGALDAASVTVNIPPGTCINLAVNWLYFRGKPSGNNVLLEWGTNNEVNNDFFTIEKSRDGIEFETLTTVKAFATTEEATSAYSFTDLAPNSVNYYRISQTDNSGEQDYYRTIQVALVQNFKAHHYATGDYFQLATSGATPGNATISVFGIDGRRVSAQKVILANEARTYQVAKPLHPGMYFLYLESNGGKLYSNKIIVE